MRVWQGCCVGEASPLNQFLSAFGLVQPRGCYSVHHGRVCQDLLPGDLIVVIPAGRANTLTPSVAQTVAPGASVPVTVHNNGCTGHTTVVKKQNGLGGTLAGAQLINSTSTNGQLVVHYDAFKMAEWETRRTTTPDNTIYAFVDATLTYTAPNPCGPGPDVYEFTTDGQTRTVTFTCSSTPTTTTTPGPSVAGFSPSTVTAGAGTVEIAGSNLGGSGATVTLNGVTLPVIGSSINTVTVSVPNEASSGPMRLTANGITVEVGFLNVQETAVRLDFPFGIYPAGTDIALRRLTGGNIAGLDFGCNSTHYHSSGFVVIDSGRPEQQGPGLDPNSSGCGFGRLVLIMKNQAPLRSAKSGLRR